MKRLLFLNMGSFLKTRFISLKRFILVLTLRNHLFLLLSYKTLFFSMASELSPPPEPTVAQLFALVMEECEAAHADRKAILAALHLLTQLSAERAASNSNFREEHQRLRAVVSRKRKIETQGEAKAPTPRSLPRRCNGCFNCGDEGHIIRECPHEQRPRELTHLSLFNAARKNQGPARKK